MIETLADQKAEVDDLSASALLAVARDRKAAEDRAAADLLEVAARWADLHPPQSIHTAAVFSDGGRYGLEREEPIAGDGCPAVAEFCIAELGTVLGISSTSAKRLIGHALELRHRLPRLWAQVQAGQVPAWRARTVAEATIHATPSLTVEAARWVDTQVAAVAGRVGPAQLDRLVAETIKRHGGRPRPDRGSGGRLPRRRPAPRDPPPRGRALRRHDAVRGRAGHRRRPRPRPSRCPRRGDAEGARLGSTLDTRRSQALGDLARTQTALDLHAQGSTGARSEDGLPIARQVVLHAHFDAGSEGLHTVFGPTGRLEEGQRLVLLDQVRDWCGDSRTKVTVKPVIDLTAELTAPGYDIPDRIREQVILRDRTCVFPWCTRPARACDIDHVISYDHEAAAEGRTQPGSTVGLEPPPPECRWHHRLKTHTGWRYDVAGPGVYEWTSPHGHRYRRDRNGTTRIRGADDGADPPDRP